MNPQKSEDSPKKAGRFTAVFTASEMDILQRVLERATIQGIEAYRFIGIVEAVKKASNAGNTDCSIKKLTPE
jgi:hypothetical protein